MTSNEMKETIRKKINDAWNDFEFMERTYGIDSSEERTYWYVWYELSDLWDTLFPNEDWRGDNDNKGNH